MPDETLIEGKWLYENNKMHIDKVCERIEWLVLCSLHKVCTDESGWEVLFQDSSDDRYWVHYYPKSEIHGGGPPCLKVITKEEAELKFNGVNKHAKLTHFRG